jgi:tyrosine-protein phosphatase SIW14
MPRFVALLLVTLLALGLAAAPLLRLVTSDRELRNFRAVTPGVMYRSGQTTPAGFERIIEEHGIRTVVSFRDGKSKDETPPDEFESEYCKARGVDYHRFTPLRWDVQNGVMPAQENVDKFVSLITDPNTKWPVLVHCFAGVHRTGTFTAIYRMEKEGWSSADAVREMLTIGRDKGGFEADVLSYLNGYQPRTPARRIPSGK